MTVQKKYLTSIIETFSTYLESLNVSPKLSEESTSVLIKFLQFKKNYDDWSMVELEKFLNTQNVGSNNAVLIRRFIENFTPYQTDIFLHQFLQNLKNDNRSESTIKNYRSDIGQFITLSQTTKIENLLTQKNVKAFVKQQFGKKLKTASIKRKLISIAQFSAWAEKQGLIKDISFWISDIETMFNTDGKNVSKKIEKNATGTTNQATARPANDKTKPPGNTKLSSDQVEDFLIGLEIENASKSTVKNYKSDLKQFIKFIGDQPLQSLITRENVNKFVDYQKAKGLKPASIKRKLVSLSKFTAWAEKRGDLKQDSLFVQAINQTPIETQTEKKTDLSSWEKHLNQSSEVVVPPGLEVTTKLAQTEAENVAQTQNTRLKIPPQRLVRAHQNIELKLKNRSVENKIPSAKHENSVTSRSAKPSKRWSLPIPKFFNDSTEFSKNDRNTYGARLKTSLKEFSDSINKANKSFLPYFNLAMIVLFIFGIGFFGYNQFIEQTPDLLAYPTSPKKPNRELSFQGRLTDTAQNPVTTATNMAFRLYDTGPGTGGTLLWDSSTCSVTPDQDGIFNVGLGDDCGSEITEDVFSENSNVWLEVDVASETLTPRQSIKTVAYALNAETVQGYPISATGAATTNTILTMDSAGQVILGEVSPTLKATTGTFSIEAQALTIQTSSGSNGDIILNPDGLGEVLSTGYFSAPGATFSATYADGTSLVLKGAPSGTANIQEWQNAAGTALSVVDENGNVGIGTSNPVGTLNIANSGASEVIFTGASSANIYQAQSAQAMYLNTNTGNLYLGTGGSGSQQVTIDSNGNIGIGTTSPESLLAMPGNNTITFSGVSAQDQDSTIGTDIYDNLQFKFGGGSGKMVQFLSNTTNLLSIGYSNTVFNESGVDNNFRIESGTDANAFYIDAGLNNVGIGTNVPTQKLDINGTLNLTSGFYANGDAGTSGYLLTSSAGGAMTWTDPASLVASSLWNNTGNVYHPSDEYAGVVDLAIGGTSTASADIQLYSDGSSVFNEQGNDADFRVEASGQANALLVQGSDGNVGIGNNSPISRLDVAGNILIDPRTGGTTSSSLTLSGYDSGLPTDASIVSTPTGALELNVQSGNFITFNDGTEENVRINAFGNVGIGTTNPASSLHISKLTGEALRLEGTSTGAYQTYYDTGGSPSDFYAGLNNAAITNKYSIGDASSNTPFFTLDTSGNVGIGTTSPSYKLDVSGTGRFTGAVDFDGDVELNSTLTDVNNSAGTSGQVLSSTGTGVDWVDASTLSDDKYVAIDGSATPGYIGALSSDGVLRTDSTLTYTDGGDYITLGVDASALDESNFDHGLLSGLGDDDHTQYALLSGRDGDILNIDQISAYDSAGLLLTDDGNNGIFVQDGGNVGIGTTSPAAMLDVRGSVEFNRTGTATVGDISINGTNNPTLYFGRLSSTSSDSTNFVFRSRLNQNKFTIDTAGGGDITSFFENNGGGSFVVKRLGGNNATFFQVNESTGNVGIGTTSPAATLEVNGTADQLQQLVQAHSTQTANLTEWQNSSGTVLSSIDEDGKFRVGSEFNDNPEISINANRSVANSNTQALAIFKNTYASGSGHATVVVDSGATSAFSGFGFNQVGSPKWAVGAYNSDFVIQDPNDSYVFPFRISTGAGSDYFSMSSSGLAIGTNQLVVNKTSGNVGIGTTSPAYKLDVLNASAGDNVGLAYFRGSTSGSNTGGFYIRNYSVGSDDDRVGLYWQHENVANMRMWMGDNQYLYSSSSTPTSNTNGRRFIQENSSGNVGIGTTSPAYKLDVAGELNLTDAIRANGDAGTSGYLLTSSGGGVNTWTDPATITGAGWWDNTSNVLHPKNEYASVVDLVIGGNSTASADIQLKSNGQAYFGGNVGIGTDNPLSNLDILSPVNSNNEVRLNTTSGGYNSSILFRVGYSTRGTIWGEGSASDAKFNLGATTSNPFITIATGGVNIGNVGIGTTSPSYKLDVSGTLRATGNVNFNGLSTGTDNSVLVQDSTGNLVTDEIDSRVWGTTLIDGSGSSNRVAYWSDADTLTNSANFTFDGTYAGLNELRAISSSGLKLYDDGGSGIFVADGGNVGIGTTNPGAKLDVAGGDIYLDGSKSLGFQGSKTERAMGVNIIADSGGSLTGDNLQMGIYGSSIFSGFQILQDTGGTPLLEVNGFNGNLIVNQGNVGIGTTSPAYKLDVAGELNLTDAIRANGDAGTSGYLLTSSGGGVNTWTDPATITGAGWWDNTSNVLHPKNEYASVVDLVIGGNSTASADIQLKSNGQAYFGGNVGIGTSTPAQLLEIAGATYGDTILRLNNVIHTWDLEAGETSYSSQALTFYYDGTKKIRVMPTSFRVLAGSNLVVDDNVGIGTTAPGQKLEVTGGSVLISDSSGKLYLNDTNNYLTAPSGDQLGIQGFNGTEFFIQPASQKVAQIGGYNSLDSFFTGNVGIGTTSPSGKLHVYSSTGTSNFYINGDAAGFPRIYIGGSSSSVAGVFNRITSGAGIYFGESTDTGTSFFRGTGGIEVSGTNASNPIVAYVENGASNATTNFARLALGPHSGYTSTNAPYIQGYNNGNDAGLTFGTYSSSLQERMRITDTGNVGIGTTAPTHKLEVKQTDDTAATGLFISDSSSNTWGLSLYNNNSGLESYIKSVTNHLKLESDRNISIKATGGGWSNPLTFTTSNAMTYGTGNSKFIQGTVTWAPTSGTGDFTGLYLNPTINQSGSAAGNYTGLDVHVAETSFSGSRGLIANFRTSSKNVLAVNKNGGVGVGTLDPDQGLHIYGSDGNGASLKIERDSVGYWRTTISNGAYVGNDVMMYPDDNTSSFNIGNPSQASQFHIRSLSGNVGINTTNPAYKLDVSGTGRFTGAVDFDGDIELNSTLTDVNNSAGTNGQILSSTGTGVDWVDATGLGTDDQTLAEVLAQGNSAGTYDIDMNNNALLNIDWSTSDDGSGSGLDADLFDGLNNTSFLRTEHLSSRSISDANEADNYGLTAHYLPGAASNKPTGTDHALFTQSYSTSWSTQIASDWRTNNWYVRTQNNGAWNSWEQLWHSGNDGTGSGLDADLFDGIDSGSFLRSDTSDNYTSGTLTFNSGTELDMASGSTLDVNGNISIADTDIALDGASTNLTATGNFSINSDDLYINKASGNVGIGTSAPAVNVDVQNNGASAHVSMNIGPSAGATDKESYLNFYRANSGSTRDLIGTISSGIPIAGIRGFEIESKLQALGFSTPNSSVGHIVFNPKGVEAVRIQHDGNVGIGTTSPSYKLDVVGASGSITALFGDGSTDATEKNTQIASRHYTNAEQPLAILRAQSTSSQNYLYLGGGTATQNAITNLIFYTGATNTTVTGTERMRINQSGNVGIGTTSPGEKLEVIGNVSVGNSASSRVELSNGGGSLSIAEYYSVESSPRLAIGRDTFNSGAAGIALGGASGYAYIGTNNTTGDALIFSTNGSATLGQGLTYERMRIDGSGNVGIGTTAPSELLTVTGNLLSIGGAYGSEDSNTVHITKPAGAAFSSGSSSETGAIKITLPQSWTNTMMRMEVEIYDYASDESFTVKLGGYNYSGSNTWTNTFAQIIAGKTNRDFTVRFGHDGTTNAIWIGETTSTWGYPKVVVTDFVAGHSNANMTNWGDGWDISIDNDFTGDTISSTETNNLVSSFITSGNNLYNVNSGNIGIGTTSPAYKLDVAGELNLTDAIRVAGDAGTSGYLLTSSAGGAMTWTDPASLVASSLWTNTGNVYHPSDEYAGVVDLAIGGTSTASANIHLQSSGQAYFAGNIGIGTTSPQFDLDNGQIGILNGQFEVPDGVVFSNYANGAFATIRTNGIDIGLSSAGGGASYGDIDSAAAYGINFQIDGTDKVAIEGSSGNVGIGTVSPDELLEVESAGAGSGAHIGESFLGTWDSSTGYAVFTHDNLKASGNSYALLQSNSGDTFLNAANGQTLDFRINNQSRAKLESDGDWAFQTDTLFLDYSTSNVGIGTTTPAYTLDVVGELNLTDAIRVAGNAGTSGYLLTSSGGGAMTWTDPSSLGGASALWANTANVYHAVNEYASVIDLVIGGTATASADIQLYSDGSAVFNEQGNDADFRVEGVGAANALFVQGSDGNVGIGTTAPASKLDIVDTTTSASSLDSISSSFTITPTSAGGSYTGIDSRITSDGTQNISGLTGLFFEANNSSSGVLASSTGIFGRSTTTSGTITNAYGVSGDVYANNGNVTNAYGLTSQVWADSGTVTNGYALYLYDVDANTSYGVYQAGANDTNYFAGNIGIGTNAPTYALDVAGDVGVNEHIYHNDDTNTYIDFNDDQIQIQVGGENMLTLTEDGTQDIVLGNKDNADIDFVWNGNTTAEIFTIDANTEYTGVGTTAPWARFHVREETALGSTSGNFQLASTLEMETGNNVYQSTWLYRDAAGSDWLTARVHDGISVDGSYWSPGSSTRTWWERDPNSQAFYWGSGADTYLTLSSTTLTKTQTSGDSIIYADNTGTTSTDNSYFFADVSGASGGDPYSMYRVAGVYGWTVGVDNSDSDKFKISGGGAASPGSGDMLTIQTDGNVGIGTTSAGEKLEVAGNVELTGRLTAGGNQYDTAGVSIAYGSGRNMFIAHVSDNTLDRGISMRNSGGSYTNSIFAEYNGTANQADLVFTAGSANATVTSIPERMRIAQGGNIGVNDSTPTYKLDVNGTIRGYGITDSSDISLKENITTINGALGKILQLRGVNYYWKDTQSYGSNLQLGLIAQEVESIIPEVVSTAEDNGLKSIAYGKLAGIFVEGIKEQQIIINKQTGEVNLLKSQVASQAATIDTLQDVVDSNTALLNSLLNENPDNITSITGLLELDALATSTLVTDELETKTATVAGTLSTQRLEAQKTTLGDLLAQDATVSGTLLAESIEASTASTIDFTAENATVSGTLLADRVEATSTRISALEAGMAQLEHVRATTAELMTATVSGTLYADNIYDFENKVATSLKTPSLLELLTGQNESTVSSTLMDELYETINKTEFEATTTADLDLSIQELSLVVDDVTLTGTALFIEQYFKVNGAGYISDSLAVGNTIFVNNSMMIGNDNSYTQFANGSIAYTTTNPDDQVFEIQPTGQGSIELLAGLLTLDDSGLAVVNGDFEVRGNVKVEETLLADLLQPTDFGNPLQVQVAGVDTESGEVKKSRFEIINEVGTPVATFSAEGKAEFAGGIGIASEDLGSSDSNELDANKTSGKAAIKSGSSEVKIKTGLISDKTLVYVTAVGSTDNQVLYVKAQTAENPDTPEAEGEFTVGFDNPTTSDVSFNWWIVN